MLLKARATGFGKPCKKPGLAWLLMAGFGWLKPPGQSQHITICSAYQSGLKGKAAAWAVKEQKGH
jgi:hypothetical protein